jgi:hypothetical protein
MRREESTIDGVNSVITFSEMFDEVREDEGWALSAAQGRRKVRYGGSYTG